MAWQGGSGTPETDLPVGRKRRSTRNPGFPRVSLSPFLVQSVPSHKVGKSSHADMPSAAPGRREAAGKSDSTNNGPAQSTQGNVISPLRKPVAVSQLASYRSTLVSQGPSWT